MFYHITPCFFNNIESILVLKFNSLIVIFKRIKLGFKVFFTEFINLN